MDLVFQSTSNFKIQYGKDAKESTVSSVEVAGPSILPPTTVFQGTSNFKFQYGKDANESTVSSMEKKTIVHAKEDGRVVEKIVTTFQKRKRHGMRNFIQLRLNYSYWVGLRKDRSQFQWVHQKDTKLSSD
ncbi:hypothetical protein A6R68_15734, partial [Neotoma lepida]